MTAELRREVLMALRDQARRQSDTSVILHLDLQSIAAHNGVPESELRTALKDVLLEGLAEPYATTFTDHAEAGHCRITEAGMAELRLLES